jgi:hypothetical protein
VSVGVCVWGDVVCVCVCVCVCTSGFRCRLWYGLGAGYGVVTLIVCVLVLKSDWELLAKQAHMRSHHVGSSEARLDGDIAFAEDGKGFDDNELGPGVGIVRDGGDVFAGATEEFVERAGSAPAV